MHIYLCVGPVQSGKTTELISDWMSVPRQEQHLRRVYGHEFAENPETPGKIISHGGSEIDAKFIISSADIAMPRDGSLFIDEVQFFLDSVVRDIITECLSERVSALYFYGLDMDAECQEWSGPRQVETIAKRMAIPLQKNVLVAECSKCKKPAQWSARVSHGTGRIDVAAKYEPRCSRCWKAPAAVEACG